jgi:aryl-alcohol dehydrogenase-like predicted oxidoreductase
MSQMRLALGTAQFGLAYGIAGRGGAVPEKEVRAILEEAAARGLRTLDTAAGYGDIETRLARLSAGLPLDFVSKVPAIPAELAPAQAAEFAVGAAARSRDRLGPALRGLMLHRAQDLAGERGAAIWPVLERWSAAEGVVIGASCYTPDEAGEIVERHRIGLLQLPGNALDQRIARSVHRAGFARCEVHLRSAFLQGLLLMPPEQVVRRLPAAVEPVRRWHAWADRQGLRPLEAALSVVKSFSSVSVVVVGVDSLAQWQVIADAWSRTQAIEAPELAVDIPAVIDPRLWAQNPA